jgi:hypothetical protein
MRSFTDRAGTKWDVEINVSAIKRVRGLLNINLLDVVDGKLLDDLIRDPIRLCDIIYALCKPQADQLGLNDEAFGQRMAGDAIAQATDALTAEIVDFFPNAQDRANLARVLETTAAALTSVRTRIAHRIENLGPVIAAAVEQVLADGSELSTSSPVSPESIPAP